MSGRQLLAKKIEVVRVGTYEDDSLRCAAASEFRILCEETVARVDSVDLMFPGQSENVIDVKICAYRRATATDQIGFIGAIAMWRQHVLFAVERNRLFTQLGAGLKDTHGDLTTICCQYPSNFPHG